MSILRPADQATSMIMFSACRSVIPRRLSSVIDRATTLLESGMAGLTGSGGAVPMASMLAARGRPGNYWSAASMVMPKPPFADTVLRWMMNATLKQLGSENACISVVPEATFGKVMPDSAPVPLATV